ncbi:MAG: 3-keto-disaccharide hydrolase [Limisphaerales bacterium]
MKTAATLLFITFALIGMARAEDAINPTNQLKLFNGKDFSGWTFCMKDNADPMQTWSVTNHVIHCTGTPSGYLRTTRAYSNYVLTVVWRFIKIAPKADNTGVLVHIQSPDKVWPECVQVQAKHEHQGDLFLMAGAESKEHKGLDANTPLPKHGPSAEKAVGEWNTCWVVCSGNDVKTYINRRFMNETTNCTVSSGFIGIQSEGGDIEIRRIYLEPLR